MNARLNTATRRKLDKIWAECVKLIGSRRCWWCNTTQPPMHAHHLFHKNAFPAGRYLLANGRCLCGSCHFKLHCNRETAFLADIVAEMGAEQFHELKVRCLVSRGSYNAVQFERDLKDLNDKLVTLGGTTE